MIFEVGKLTAELPPITLFDDSYVELDESFEVEIFQCAPDGVINGGRKKTTVTILNDDGM